MLQSLLTIALVVWGVGTIIVGIFNFIDSREARYWRKKRLASALEREKL